MEVPLEGKTRSSMTMEIDKDRQRVRLIDTSNGYMTENFPKSAVQDRILGMKSRQATLEEALRMPRPFALLGS